MQNKPKLRRRPLHPHQESGKLLDSGRCKCSIHAGQTGRHRSTPPLDSLLQSTLLPCLVVRCAVTVVQQYLQAPQLLFLVARIRKVSERYMQLYAGSSVWKQKHGCRLDGLMIFLASAGFKFGFTAWIPFSCCLAYPISDPSLRHFCLILSYARSHVGRSSNIDRRLSFKSPLPVSLLGCQDPSMFTQQ